MSITVSRQADLSVALTMAGGSDTGRKRDHNEDRVEFDPTRGIAILADGMGGHRCGEVASALAVESILKSLTEGLDAPGEAADGYSPEAGVARDAVEQSNTAIHQAARGEPAFEGMGTTIVVTVFRDDRVTIAHVGDSRAYRLRAGHLEQLTQDHTLMEELVQRGFYTPEEARESLNRNILTRALGVEAGITVDVMEDVVVPGDIYLLCSDGLSDMLDDEQIRATLADNGDELQCLADRLIQQANSNGGDDNVSVVLVRVKRAFPATRESWIKRFVDWFQ